MDYIYLVVAWTVIGVVLYQAKSLNDLHDRMVKLATAIKIDKGEEE